MAKRMSTLSLTQYLYLPCETLKTRKAEASGAMTACIHASRCVPTSVPLAPRRRLPYRRPHNTLCNSWCTAILIVPRVLAAT